MKRIMLAAVLFVIVAGSAGGFFVSRSAYSSHGSVTENVEFMFAKGEGTVLLASRLQDAGLIGHESSFLWYLWREGHLGDLQAGEYLFSGSMTIPDIAGKLVRGETVQKGVKITFPEGWTAAEMADRLTANGLPGNDFLALVNAPKDVWRAEFPIIAMIPAGRSLEGFLFPDTYFFDPKAGADKIIGKMLGNFQTKAEPVLASDGPSDATMDPYHRLVLASLLESEVRTSDDRKMVADLFLRRISVGMPLQSDATVKYVLGVSKVQHSLADIAVDSPYNTYKYPGLPPGPIGNPGLSSMQAAIHPTPSPYWYFLNNPQTGKTVFSATFEEHVANKAKNGL
jgi:UPF0755 protein